MGWELSDDVLLRGSKSTSFRVPNLIQANQLYVTRSGNVDDAVGEYVGGDPLEDRHLHILQQHHQHFHFLLRITDLLESGLEL